MNAAQIIEQINFLPASLPALLSLSPPTPLHPASSPGAALGFPFSFSVFFNRIVQLHFRVYIDSCILRTAW
jgi:hypothetical protein